MIRFLGWFTLTYFWLSANLTFANAIEKAIDNHNDAIRQEALQEIEDEDEDSDCDDCKNKN